MNKVIKASVAAVLCFAATASFAGAHNVGSSAGNTTAAKGVYNGGGSTIRSSGTASKGVYNGGGKTVRNSGTASRGVYNGGGSTLGYTWSK